MDEELSPSLQQKVTYLGTVLCSFPEAHRAVERVVEQLLGVKRIERLTEQIGSERVRQREAEVEAWKNITLTEKLKAPPGIKPPQVAAVVPDGGRLQLRDTNEDHSTHWHEYKAGCLLELDSTAQNADPCPQLPEMFLNREHIEMLTREIGKKAADAEEDCPGSPAPRAVPAMTAGPPPSADYEPPKVLAREVVATRRKSLAFGQMLAARAWRLGMFGSQGKAYVGDGQNWLWAVWERHFKAFGFVPILDLIHALTYIFAAATAGRERHEGWEVYQRWMTWVWQGNVSQVIPELAARQHELGLPTDNDGPSSVRRIVSEALTYLQNQQSKMNYPAYRREGLPITSSHIESTVKLLNHRVKGSEKFWSEWGAEALLQLKADTLSETQPLEKFWRDRPTTMTGHRSYVKTAA